jgi:hypothetical protein
VITNATVPVSGTVGLSGPISATLSGTPTVSATITNTATNPVAVTGDRPTPYNQTAPQPGPGSGQYIFPIPTGCRLVIQAVGFQVTEPNATQTAHLPQLFVNNSSAGNRSVSYIIPTQQVTYTSGGLAQVTTSGTLSIPISVDSTYTLSGEDFANLFTTNQVWSISGYLLPLTAGGICSNP